MGGARPLPAPVPAGAVLRLLMALWLAIGFAAVAQAQTFPKFTGLVTDAAGVLPADRKAALEQRLEVLQQQTQHQLVVATIPDLQGYDIADYGYRLGRAWQVGLKDANNGAILIVAPKERKVRIEVGNGLEGVLTDALSSVIVNQTILPRFKAGDMPGGIEAGANAIAAQLRLPDDQARAKAAAAAQAYDKTHRRNRASGGIPVGAIIFIAIVGFVVLASFRRKMAGTQPYRATQAGGGGSNWPIWLWAASEMMSDRNRGGFGEGGGGGGLFGGSDGGGSDGSWGGGGFTGGGGGSFGGGGASGDW